VEHFQNRRDRHLFGPGPKRILSLDGGGVRGVATIAFLEHLEEEISEIEGRPTLLGEWFDLIGGTSTGAILATALALGYRASDIKRFYHQLAPRVFRRSRFRIFGWQAKFEAARLKQELAAIIGERTLDSDDLMTGLCMVLKRLDTGSSWIVLNNPRSVFWETPEDKCFIGNRYLKVANVVRASTAAPSYFDPEVIEIVAGQPHGVFIDGGLTPHNNPALILWMAAVIPAYGFNWKMGVDDLLIVSLGTGSFRTTLTTAEATRASAIGLAVRSLAAMISESQLLTLTLMSYLGQSPVPWRINSEIGDLGPIVPQTGNLFRFLRYDIRLEESWLKQELNETLAPDVIERLRHMDDPAGMSALYDLGQKAADLQIKREHLEPAVRTKRDWEAENLMGGDRRPAEFF
jgi:predicted acylesterase/phospholipase RssA